MRLADLPARRLLEFIGARTARLIALLWALGVVFYGVELGFAFLLQQFVAQSGVVQALVPTIAGVRLTLARTTLMIAALGMIRVVTCLRPDQNRRPCDGVVQPPAKTRARRQDPWLPFGRHRRHTDVLSSQDPERLGRAPLDPPAGISRRIRNWSGCGAMGDELAACPRIAGGCIDRGRSDAHGQPTGENHGRETGQHVLDSHGPARECVPKSVADSCLQPAGSRTDSIRAASAGLLERHRSLAARRGGDERARRRTVLAGIVVIAVAQTTRFALDTALVVPFLYLFVRFAQQMGGFAGSLGRLTHTLPDLCFTFESWTKSGERGWTQTPAAAEALEPAETPFGWRFAT